MKAAQAIVVGIVAALSVSTPAAQSMRLERPASEGPFARRGPQHPSATFEVFCRGGGPLRLERQSERLGLFFSQSPILPGADGSSLAEGTCSPAARLFAPTEPPGIEFGTAAEYDKYRSQLGESDRIFRFTVSAGRGMFIATDQRSWRMQSVPTPQTGRVVHSPADPILETSDSLRDRTARLAIGRITGVRVTPRDRSVRFEFIAAPNASAVVLIVSSRGATLQEDGLLRSWIGAPMVLNAQRDAAASSPAVTRYVADSLSHRLPFGDHLPALDPAASYHYVITDKNDPQHARVGGSFTTLDAFPSANATGAGAPAADAPGADRGIIIVGGKGRRTSTAPSGRQR